MLVALVEAWERKHGRGPANAGLCAKATRQLRRRAALADLALLDSTTDQQTNSFAWTDTLNLADHLHLTVYEAAYLELARRRNAATRYARRGTANCRSCYRCDSTGELTSRRPRPRSRLARAGVEFIGENGGGAGVRLRKPIRE